MTLTKGERTRELILAHAAALFNTKGYGRVSMSDIMKETGLEKGGIYNHFRSKEELALAAFNYMVEMVTEAMRGVVTSTTSSVDRLHGLINVFTRLVEHPLFLGGCPVLNAAVESDDADPDLRESARAAMDNWFRALRITLERGINRGEFRPDIDVEGTASIIIGSLEGAIMLSKLYGDPVHIHRATAHLNSYIEAAVRA